MQPGDDIRFVDDRRGFPLMAATPLLFTPIDLRGVRLKNPIVLSPMLVRRRML